MTDSERLAHMYLALVKELHLFRRKGLIQQGSMDVSNAEHALILKRLRIVTQSRLAWRCGIT